VPWGLQGSSPLPHYGHIPQQELGITGPGFLTPDVTAAACGEVCSKGSHGPAIKKTFSLNLDVDLSGPHLEARQISTQNT